jgi:hypothetical protein
MVSGFLENDGAAILDARLGGRTEGIPILDIMGGGGTNPVDGIWGGGPENENVVGFCITWLDFTFWSPCL